MSLVFDEHDVPNRYLSSWQEILNLAAGLMEVPSANIMRRDGKQIEVLVTSTAGGNPYRTADRFALKSAGLCAHVMETGRPLMVRDVSNAPQWRHRNGTFEDMSAYFGLPLYWPGGEVFGTICVQDRKARNFSGAHLMLLESFKDLVEKDFAVMAQHHALSSENAERKEIEKALRNYAEGLEARNAELDAYAHTVAHELKGPLSGILLSAELLVDDFAMLSASEVKRDLSAIVHAAKKMSDIVDDLLLLAGLRQMKAPVAPLEMKRIVVDALGRLSSLVKEYDAIIELPTKWPVALGYGPWVEEVWVNYVSNAIKYGGRPPFIRIETGMSSDGMVHFAVRDNGRGLRKEEQRRLFAPFDRVGRAGGRGYGLGLSIARRITERLNGAVHVRSEEGQGSIFGFSLPAAR